MGLSKRLKARREADRQAEILWLKERQKNPPPPEEWTEYELSQMDKMKSILDTLTVSQGHNIDLVSELLSSAWVFHGSSMRIADLQIKVPHYRKLSQYPAKENLRRKIYGNFSGLYLELQHLRNSKRRGGTNVQ
jgi:hypothetical protein